MLLPRGTKGTTALVRFTQRGQQLARQLPQRLAFSYQAFSIARFGPAVAHVTQQYDKAKANGS